MLRDDEFEQRLAELLGNNTNDFDSYFFNADNSYTNSSENQDHLFVQGHDLPGILFGEEIPNLSNQLFPALPMNVTSYPIESTWQLTPTPVSLPTASMIDPNSNQPIPWQETPDGLSDTQTREPEGTMLNFLMEDMPSLELNQIDNDEETKEPEPKKARNKSDISNKLYIGSKKITRGAFLKRDYMFVDDTEQHVSKADKHKAEIHEDGKVFVDDREIIWNQKNGLYKNLRMVYLDGKTVTRDAFLRRDYMFADDTEQHVSKENMYKAEIREDGKVFVGDREIIWNQKNCLPNRENIVYPEGKAVTWNTFLKRDYMFADSPEQRVSTPDKNKAEIREDGKVFVGDREIIWNRAKRLYKNLSMVYLDGKTVTRDAFLKRDYVFADDTEQHVSKENMYKAEILDDGKVFVGDREIIWEPKKNTNTHRMSIQLGDKQITWGGFLKRNYFFVDNPRQPVALEEKKQAVVQDGRIFVNNREIIWKPKQTTSSYTASIQLGGKQITWAAFLKRNYFFVDNPQQPVALEEKKQAVVQDGRVFVNNREIIWCRSRTPTSRKRKREENEDSLHTETHPELSEQATNNNNFYRSAPRGLTMFSSPSSPSSGAIEQTDVLPVEANLHLQLEELEKSEDASALGLRQ